MCTKTLFANVCLAIINSFILVIRQNHTMEENVLCTCLQSFICVLLPHRPPGGATIKKPGRFSFQTLSHSTLSASGKQEKERESTRREREIRERELCAAALSDFFSSYIFPIPLSWAHFNFMPQSWLAALSPLCALCTKALCRLDNPQYVCFHQQRESLIKISRMTWWGIFQQSAEQRIRRQQTTKNHIIYIHKLLESGARAEWIMPCRGRLANTSALSSGSHFLITWHAGEWNMRLIDVYIPVDNIPCI